MSAVVDTWAANALSLLLREDPLLVQHGLVNFSRPGPSDAYPTSSTSSSADAEIIDVDADAPSSSGIYQDDAAHSYAAALLHDSFSGDDSSGWMTSANSEYRQRATEALAEVDRKLMLVESLSQRISREAPEEVAGPLLRLHGFELARDDIEGDDNDHGGKASQPSSGNNLVTLTATRDKAERLQRQSSLLDTVAKRVESTLQRGVTRMESATTRLSRV